MLAVRRVPPPCTPGPHAASTPSGRCQNAAVDQLNEQSYQAAQNGQAFSATDNGSSGTMAPSGSGRMNGMSGAGVGSGTK